MKNNRYYNYNRLTIKGKIASIIVAVLILAFALLPIYWGFSASFKYPGEYYGKPPTLYPVSPNLDSYGILLAQRNPNFGRGLLNSAIVASATALLAVLVALPGGYALARFTFRGKSVAWLTFFVTQITGSTTFLIIPMYIIVHWLGLYDTYFALLLPYVASSIPFASLLMSGFVTGLSPEVEEAAMVHGSTRIGAVFRITLPLILPGLISAGIFVFATVFNEFILATTLTQTDAARTAFPMLWIFYTSPFAEWAINSLFAGVVLLSLPVVALFVVLQRRFVEGFTQGMIKG